ncbi:cellulose synthase/poly-beta-1,6-N-acetylglucosamine synthase-like glycosyltransferase [Palleronia aestuarii]|uniref:Cellulose synthase/poly-beta-1,6-N-acetylglucosamine synthase-like glycosyltransferase n=1 Tax=Palleronia aestuarii TaxID=568105 RepID=A0A2W7NEQ5_9RHOB|nr:glycosyltransferase family 2 protein [Palleronia aestuarii]PZX15204.1 cellulose synthase/poly-beta-1,6-N-acetylglucosamine synthase-like glycosyltransferase [Palleronia aestuarii]
MPQPIFLAAIPHDASRAARPRIGDQLVEAGDIDNDTLDWALMRQRGSLATFGEILERNGHITEERLYAMLAEQFQTELVRFPGERIAPDLLDRLGPSRCATDRIAPLGRRGGVTLVATSRPNRFDGIRPDLEAVLGPVAMVVALQSELGEALSRMRRHHLVRQAETRAPGPHSARTLYGSRRWTFAAIFAAVFLVPAIMMPMATFMALSMVAFATLIVNTALLVVATHLDRVRGPDERGETIPTLARMPKVTLLVPLFRETEIAGDLLARLDLLDYPRELLDICLVTESCDRVTAATLARTTLPSWIRIVSVAPGSIQTKPRAMNYALDFCDGSIIGVYDAEDQPAPDQILRVVRHFAASTPEIACLQGRLNFYNARDSWISRCFCIEYSTWFSMTLPALRKLGWALPLGGTTVFFRRAALEAVGAWDAHNVTEDADLGMRLARHGYRTELLNSTTEEEATTSAWKWIRQRSRWLKGYAITYAVHMRNPLQLARDLGPWGFVGFQVLFLSSLLSTLLAPILWSFALLSFDIPHPLRGEIPANLSLWLMVGMSFTAICNWAASASALIRMGKPELIPWIPVQYLYYPLATVAILKSLVELLVCPTFWDKTEHGVSKPDAVAGRA